jgi:MerR family transcriptional regulator, copper efflux regulator
LTNQFSHELSLRHNPTLGAIGVLKNVIGPSIIDNHCKNVIDDSIGINENWCWPAIENRIFNSLYSTISNNIIEITTETKIMTFTIGHLSSKTTCSVPSIRYYEKIGLLPPPKRTSSGHRYYTENDIKRLSSIRRCRRYGFSIKEITALLKMEDDQQLPCSTGRKLVKKRLENIRQNISELKEIELTLENYLLREAVACEDTQRSPACSVMKSLQNPLFDENEMTIQDKSCPA